MRIVDMNLHSVSEMLDVERTRIGRRPGVDGDDEWISSFRPQWPGGHGAQVGILEPVQSETCGLLMIAESVGGAIGGFAPHPFPRMMRGIAASEGMIGGRIAPVRNTSAGHGPSRNRNASALDPSEKAPPHLSSECCR